MGNATSSVAEIKMRGEKSRAQQKLGHSMDGSGRRPGLSTQISSKRFKKDDPGAEQWKIFNDLDVQDDKMMLELAVFLNRLVKNCPAGSLEVRSSTKSASGMTDSTHLFEAGNVEGDDEFSIDSSQGLTLQGIKLDERPVPSLVRIGSVNVQLGAEGANDNLLDYSLPKSTPTIETVQEVVQLYENGGKLSVKTVRRILRDAYKVLKSLSNINRVPLNSAEENVTVVGDIHGQHLDMRHLIEANGLPSPTNKYVFNGDFVDRGANGVEVLIMLFLLVTVFPESVFLNRGNHEDFGLCCVYGFQKECLAKYNDVIFSMFCEMFRHLPVCSVIHGKVFVIHGGLFHREGVTLKDIEEVERLDYVVPSKMEDEVEQDEGLSPEEQRFKDLRTIMHCALWSDPDLDPCLPTPQPNPRGAGVLFGPDMTASFLDGNGLDMVVRSHECVEDGFDLPFEGEMEYACATVFSASNYGGSMNMGATMRFSLVETADSIVAGGDRAKEPRLFYTVHDYQLSSSDGEGIQKANQNGLSSLVLRKKRPLIAAFSQVDKTGSGYVTKDRWCKVMKSVTGLQIMWPSLIPVLVAEEDIAGDTIQWSQFMSKFHVQLSKRAKSLEDGEALFDAMYSNREKLEAIFRFFDADGNGTISRDEFHQGCELINQEAGPEDRLENYDAMLGLMDFDNNDTIDINEFFEVFRLVDAREEIVSGDDVTVTVT